jgi:GNAT superfamily N-acetyltransferase
MEVRSLGYRTDLAIRRLERSQVCGRGDYLIIRSPDNPGFWWGNFLLLSEPPQPGQGGDWLARFAAEFPGAGHVALGVDITEDSVIRSAAGLAELTAAGLAMTRSTVLTATAVHAPPRPNAEASYRRLSGDDDWLQAARLRAVISEGEPGSDPEFLAARLASERAITEAGHGSWFGAFIGDRLLAQLGLISCGAGLARYQNVETDPSARRQGLAGSLVWHAGRHALAAGDASTLVIVADPEGTAIRVYQSAGFADAQAQVGFQRQPLTTPPGA